MAHRRHPSEVRYGPGAIQAVPDIVAAAGHRRVLLVCGRRSFEASGAATMLPRLGEAAEVVRWSDFAPNTDVGDLARGLALLRRTEPDLVIGVGGGSAMDMAKLLCAYAGTDPDRLGDAITDSTPITHREPGLLLAPTTSGSGSEVTHFAVVYVDGDKHSIAGPAMYADDVVLDPELARSGSAHQRATSGIDATCQGIESLWAADATPQSRRLARHGLSTVLGAIEQFVVDPTERAARAMCLGSHLVGRAIDISKTTAAHALSYGITKRYGIDHGNAVALTLGYFIEAHSDAAPDQLRASIDPREHEQTMAWIRHRLGAVDGRSARSAFVDLLERIGLASSLSEVGLEGRPAREELVAGVNVERLGNNPVDLDQAGLLSILEQAS